VRKRAVRSCPVGASHPPTDHRHGLGSIVFLSRGSPRRPVSHALKLAKTRPGEAMAARPTQSARASNWPAAAARARSDEPDWPARRARPEQRHRSDSEMWSTSTGGRFRAKCPSDRAKENNSHCCPSRQTTATRRAFEKTKKKHRAELMKRENILGGRLSQFSNRRPLRSAGSQDGRTPKEAHDAALAAKYPPGSK
jgi:hypothetical protein